MCLKSIISTIVFVFNVICMLVGIGLITLGVMYLLSYNDLTDKLPSDYKFLHALPVTSIVIGSIITLISFFGCCGIIQGNSCLLTTYAIILLVIFLSQLALGVWAFISINDEKDFTSKFNSEIEKIFTNAKNNKEYEVTDLLQSAFKCCGDSGPSFWSNKLPNSCCPDADCSKNTPYKKGCVTKVTDFVHDSVRIIGIVTLSLSAVEIVGAVLALCLGNSIRNARRRGM